HREVLAHSAARQVPPADRADKDPHVSSRGAVRPAGPSAEPRRQRRAARIWRDLLGESSRSIEKCSRIRPQAKTRPSTARAIGSAERSERQLALGRRTARIRRIDRLCVPAEVRDNPLDRCGRLDAGNHTKAAAAAPARLDLDGEYPLEALRPRQGPLPIGDGGLAALTGHGGARSGHHPGPIERVEVLKGSHGLMYGTQAIAGVVNVVTRSTSNEPDGAITVGTGSDGLRRVNGFGRRAFGDHQLVFWASHDETDGYEIYDAYQPTSTYRKRGYDVDSVGLKYGYDFTNDLRLMMLGIHTEARLDYPSVSNVSVNDRTEDIFAFRLDYTPAEGPQYFLKGYYHDWDTDYFTPPNPSDYWGYDDYGLNAAVLLRPHEKFEYHIGYDFQSYKGQDDVLLIAGLREEVHAVHAQVRSTDALSARARFAMGIRYNETGGNEATVWNGSAIWEF